MVWNVCRSVLRSAADADDACQATFLVLARKAGSFRRGGSLASWLYGIAYRTARKAQTQATRRRVHERSVMQPPAAGDPTDEIARQELRPIVHEVLHELPERLRGPLVLCYLEGKTVAEAAQQLGYPFGSMSRLLDRGQALLRERLQRRGVALSLGGLALVLTPETGTAALPVAAIVSAARRFVGSVSQPAGTASAPAESLAEGVLHDMYLQKVKRTVTALLAVILVGAGTGVMLYAASKAPPGGEVAVATPVAEPEKADKAAELAALLKGRKLLVTFLDQPVPKKKPPTRADYAQAQKELDATIQTAMKDAKLDVLRKVKQSGTRPWMYLIDLKDQKPEDLLKPLPYEWAAVIFEDGNFQKGVCSPKGKKPTAEICQTWSSHPFSRQFMEKDLQRYRAIPRIKVDYHEPPPDPPGGPVGVGAVFWHARLIPDKGTTVLEVFLRSGIEFTYEPPAGRPIAR